MLHKLQEARWNTCVGRQGVTESSDFTFMVVHIEAYTLKSRLV